MNKFIISDSFNSSFESAIFYSLTNYNDITISVELLDQAEGIISNVLGDKIIKSLKKKKSITINFQNQYKVLNLISVKSKNVNISNSEVIIGAFITLKYLNNLMLTYPNKKFIYIPWLPSEKSEIQSYLNFTSL